MSGAEFPHGAGAPGHFDSPSLAHALSHPAPPPTHQLSPGAEPETPTGDGKKRRGPYKCSKCSKPGQPVPRLGHVCPFKPRKDGERERTTAPPVYEGVMSFAPPLHMVPPPGAPPGFVIPPGGNGLVRRHAEGADIDGATVHSEVSFAIDPRFHAPPYTLAPPNGKYVSPFVSSLLSIIYGDAERLARVPCSPEVTSIPTRTTLKVAFMKMSRWRLLSQGRSASGRVLVLALPRTLAPQNDNKVRFNFIHIPRVLC